MDKRRMAENPPKKVTLRVIGQHSDEEAQSSYVEISGNNLVRRRNIREELVEIEIDLSNDELLQGIQVTEVESTRGIVKEVATGLVAILLITFIFATTDLPQAIVLSILGSIVVFYFGMHVGRRHRR